MKTPEKYLREDDPSDPTNNVIKAKASSYMDYKLVPKICWEILHKRFGGGPELIRQKDPGQYSYNYEIKFNKVSIFFVKYWLIAPSHDTSTPFPGVAR